MLRSTLLILGLLGTLFSVAPAVSLRLDGPAPESWRVYQKKADLLFGKASDTSAVADSVRVWLINEGYLDAATEVSGDSIVVMPGNRYRLAALSVSTNSTSSLPWHGYCTPSTIDEAMAKLLQTFYRRGYYYARGTVTGLQRTGTAVNALVSVNPGPVVTIGELRFTGLSRTKSNPLEHSFLVVSGDTLTEELLASVEKAAARISYVSFMPPVMVRPRLGYTQADLELHFAEKQQFLFSGGAGYSNDERAGLVWDVGVQMQNLFGEGKELAIKSARREKSRNVLDISYRQPSSLLGAGSLHAALATRDYREQFYEFSADAGYDLQISPEATAGLTLGWKRVEPNASQGYSRGDAIVSIHRGQVDEVANPSRGYSIATSIGYSFRKYSADSSEAVASFNDTRATLRIDLYERVLGPFVGHVGVGYRGLETKEALPPVSELFFIGGPGSLRGYRNEQFVVRRTTMGTVEPRYRFTGGYLFGFVDAAFLQQPAGGKGVVRLTEETHYGYGVGLALADQARTVRLSLGWNPDIATDQPWLSVELSAGL